MIADASTSLSNGLKPYTEYKESVSQWLTKVPAHWEIRNLRTMIRSRIEVNDLQPSETDFRMREQLTEAGKILGLRVLDPIILTKKGHFSFQDAGLMKG